MDKKYKFSVIMPAYNAEQYLKDAIKAGAKDFLQKPLDSAQVKKLIDTFLEDDDEGGI